MNFRFAIFAVTIASACFLIAAPPAGAQNRGVERISNFGTIDWVGERISAVGMGAPVTKPVGSAQVRILAQRAAVVVARRNLLEVVKGVHVDSTTRMENYLLKDDKIETRVKGVLVGSTVDHVEYYSNGSAKATVSIPMTGELRQILMRIITPAAGADVPADRAGQLQKRMDALEKRVGALEKRIIDAHRQRAEYDEMIRMLQGVILAMMEYDQMRPQFVPASSHGGSADMARRLDGQEAQLKSLFARLEHMNRRIQALEKGPVAQAPAAAAKQSDVKYTGLVIDARGVGFRPCLKPEVFGRDQQIYPGDYVDLDRAVRGGYIRYYRDLAKAQQSPRIGSLPLTIKAVGTQEGNRSLAISSPDYQVLREIAEIPGSFLSTCKVVIVF